MDVVICVNNGEPGSGICQAAWVRVAAEEREIRVEKILDVKRQLAEGRYDIADKLGTVVDRLLEDLLGRGCEPQTVQ